MEPAWDYSLPHSPSLKPPLVHSLLCSLSKTKQKSSVLWFLNDQASQQHVGIRHSSHSSIMVTSFLGLQISTPWSCPASPGFPALFSAASAGSCSSNRTVDARIPWKSTLDPLLCSLRTVSLGCPTCILSFLCQECQNLHLKTRTIYIQKPPWDISIPDLTFPKLNSSPSPSVFPLLFTLPIICPLLSSALKSSSLSPPSTNRWPSPVHSIKLCAHSSFRFSSPSPLPKFWPWHQPFPGKYKRLLAEFSCTHPSSLFKITAQRYS